MMKPILPLASTTAIAALAAAAAAASAWASSTVDADRTRVAERVMQPVSHTAAAGEPGHGGRHFSDAGAHHAVVISPDGDYSFSRGKGLRLVASTRSDT